jgi:hypothetical protein
LRKLSWEMNAYTPYSFLTCFAAQGIVFRGDVMRDTTKDSDVVLRELLPTLDILATKCMLEPTIKGVVASEVAAAIVYMARRAHNIQPWWRPELENLTHCDMGCVTGIVNELDGLNIGHSIISQIEQEKVSSELEKDSEPMQESTEESHVDVDMAHDEEAEAVSFENQEEKPIIPKASPSSVVEMETTNPMGVIATPMSCRPSGAVPMSTESSFVNET